MIARGQILGTAVLSACVLAAAGPVEASDWEWTVVPYVWGADTSLDVSVNDDPVFGGDLTFDDLLDKLDIAGMVHFEGRSGRAGFFVDALYLSLSDSTTTAPNPPFLPDGAEVDTDMTLGRYEAAGFYRVAGSAEHGLDLLVGARVLDDDQNVHVTRATPSPAENSFGMSDVLLDGFVGARFDMPFADRWWFRVRGDVGAGDTELSWTAAAAVGVWFGKTRTYGLDLMYEHFAFEVQKSSGTVDVESDVSFSGPGLGFVIRF